MHALSWEFDLAQPYCGWGCNSWGFDRGGFDRIPVSCLTVPLHPLFQPSPFLWWTSAGGPCDNNSARTDSQKYRTFLCRTHSKVTCYISSQVPRSPPVSSNQEQDVPHNSQTCAVACIFYLQRAPIENTLNLNYLINIWVQTLEQMWCMCYSSLW